MRLLALALVLVVGAGCGGHKQSDTDKSVMDADFALTNYVIAAQVADAARDGNAVGLDQSTDDYIALIRKYADELGAKEVRRRLTDVANEVEPYCAECASRLDRERGNH